LLNKHLANGRRRTDNEKQGWKAQAARRKAQRAKARKESSSEAESSEEDAETSKGKRKSSSIFNRFDEGQRASRASDLVGHVLGHGGGGLLDFIEKVSHFSLL